MPFYLQVIYIVLASVVAPSVFIGVGQIWKQRVKIAEIEGRIAGLVERVSRREHEVDDRFTAIRLTMEKIEETMGSLNANVIRIAASLGVTLES